MLILVSFYLGCNKLKSFISVFQLSLSFFRKLPSKLIAEKILQIPSVPIEKGVNLLNAALFSNILVQFCKYPSTVLQKRLRFFHWWLSEISVTKCAFVLGPKRNDILRQNLLFYFFLSGVSPCLTICSL